MNIRQINTVYLEKEDRILMRLNTHDQAEIRLWLSRRVVEQVLGGLGLVQSPPAVVAETTGSTSPPATAPTPQTQADFKQPYRAEVAKLPLGEVPLLVVHGELQPLAHGFKLNMGTNNGMNITINLDDVLARSLRKLLADCARQAEWGLGKYTDTALDYSASLTMHPGTRH